jgi:CheY-like chemotaxis protein
MTGMPAIRSRPLPSSFSSKSYAGIQRDEKGAAVPAPKAPSQPVCLVADDLDSTRELMVFFLGQMGFDVVHARDGKEAVDVARAKKPALVLMDVLMPVMDGYAACREIKSQPELTGVKVIMFSALTAQADKHRAELAGADAYLEKPIDMTKLTSAIRRFFP